MDLGEEGGGDKMVKMQCIFRVSKICSKFFKEKRQDKWSECIFSVASGWQEPQEEEKLWEASADQTV